MDQRAVPPRDPGGGGLPVSDQARPGRGPRRRGGAAAGVIASPRWSRRPLAPAGAAGLLVVALTTAVLLRSGHPFPVDTALHAWFLDVRTPALTGGVRLLTATGTG